MEFTNGYERTEFENASTSCDVQDPAGRSLRIPERLLQSLWYDQYVLRDALATEDGRRVVEIGRAHV
jgi:hypothetical protein